MIYTVTLNPAIDYMIETPELRVGTINKCTGGEHFPGGKGINVSLMLTELGVENIATGICAGFSGEEILLLLERGGIETDFVKAKSGHSRINIKVCNVFDDSETDFNGSGPVLDSADLDKVVDILSAAKEDDFIVLAGATPPGADSDIYANISKRLEHTGARVIVDAAGETLLSTLKVHPFLVKPNHEELGEVFGVEIDTDEKAKKYGQELIKMGAQNVLVSCGAKGAVLCTADGETMKRGAPKGKSVSTVGAGDSMVAGFIYGFLKTKDFGQALNWGIAAGTATVLSKGIASAEDVKSIYMQAVNYF